MLNLHELFCDTLNVMPNRLRADLALGDVPEWDSVAHMGLVTALEERCGVMFDGDEVVEMTRLGAIPAVLGRYGVDLVPSDLLVA